jgi:hypothetical protein
MGGSVYACSYWDGGRGEVLSFGHSEDENFALSLELVFLIQERSGHVL